RLAEGHVQATALGPVRLKGLAEPGELHQLTGAGAARSRFQVLAGRGLTGFVGRGGEVERRAGRRGRSGAGSAARGGRWRGAGGRGVGKSRLLWEFVHAPRTEGCRILEAASLSYGQATSYLPVVELLRAYFRVDAADDPRTVREKVAGGLLARDRALEPALP